MYVYTYIYIHIFITIYIHNVLCVYRIITRHAVRIRIPKNQQYSEFGSSQWLDHVRSLATQRSMGFSTDSSISRVDQRALGQAARRYRCLDERLGRSWGTYYDSNSYKLLTIMRVKQCHKPPIWEPIYGDLGDGLLLF